MSEHSPAKKKQKYVPDLPVRTSTTLCGAATPTHPVGHSRPQSVPRVDVDKSPVQTTRPRAVSLYPTPSDSVRKPSTNHGAFKSRSPPVPAPSSSPPRKRKDSGMSHLTADEPEVQIARFNAGLEERKARELAAARKPVRATPGPVKSSKEANIPVKLEDAGDDIKPEVDEETKKINNHATAAHVREVCSSGTESDLGGEVGEVECGRVGDLLHERELDRDPD
ncbi:hypothetical protein FRC06_009122 [Ceratobasidium sp. 370]|nr:hypothetical protein FRC06_009122 [Ceratobasidium sp. 370]